MEKQRNRGDGMEKVIRKVFVDRRVDSLSGNGNDFRSWSFPDDQIIEIRADQFRELGLNLVNMTIMNQNAPELG